MCQLLLVSFACATFLMGVLVPSAVTAALLHTVPVTESAGAAVQRNVACTFHHAYTLCVFSMDCIE
jgi:hypothetical protein